MTPAMRERARQKCCKFSRLELQTLHAALLRAESWTETDDRPHKGILRRIRKLIKKVSAIRSLMEPEKGQQDGAL
jgi:hypothetical protein